MTEHHIRRAMQRAVRSASRQFPVVVVTGPRRSGKTTLARHLYARRSHVSLAPPDVRAAAESDPRGFLALHPPPAVLEDVQLAPALLPHIKEIVDAGRSRAGRFLLTASQDLEQHDGLRDAFAGRIAHFRLMPLSWREMLGETHRGLAWERRTRRPLPGFWQGRELWTALCRGGYPELVANPSRDASSWHSSYLQSYLERDVRSLRQVGSVTDFQQFLRLLAARSTQLLNLAEIARELGVVLNTVKAWLGVLEATQQILLLRPYAGVVGKRLVKRPKVYFMDTGTLCHLVGLHEGEHAMRGPMAQAILETAVVSEVYKALLHRGGRTPMCFWRTSHGTEVDLLLQMQGKLIGVEVSTSSTPRPAMASGIQSLRAALPDSFGKGYVVHPGDQTLPLTRAATALPIATL